MKESREYMLHVLWRTMNPDNKVIFLDKSENYYLPRLKFEKSVGGKLELLDTTSDIYRPVDKSFVYFAYENTIKELSDALCYSYELDRVESLLRKETVIPENALKKHQDRLKELEIKSNIHINQIKEKYGETESIEETLEW